jgi:hypothetical protein
MKYPCMHTALAYERQNTMLEKAQAARRARGSTGVPPCARHAGRPRISVARDARPAGVGGGPPAYLAAAIPI